MKDVLKAAQEVTQRHPEVGPSLCVMLNCLRDKFSETDLKEMDKGIIKIPSETLVVLGAIFLLGTQERGYRMLDVIEKAADLATMLRDQIEDTTGVPW